MPRVKRFISSKEAPVERFASAPLSLATQSTDIVGAIAGLGGQLFSAGLRNKKAAEDVRAELARKTQANVDFLKTNRARSDIKRTGLSYDAWKEVNNPDEWVKGANRFAADVEIDTQGMSPEAQQRLQQEIDLAKQEFIASSTLDAVKATGDNVVLAATASYNEVIQDSNSTEESRLAARAEFEEQVGRNRSVEVTNKLANKLDEDAVADRHKSAMDSIKEVASVKPNIAIETIDIALETLGPGDEVPEGDLSRADLVSLKAYSRSILKANKSRAEEAERDAIDQTTSDTIRGVFKGEVTIEELDKLHEDGLIKDVNYTSMRKSLAEKTPAESDNIRRSEMSTAMTEFLAGQRNKQSVQAIYLDNLPFLNAADRSKFDNDIATGSTKLVETGMSNAKKSGKELVSPRFSAPDGSFFVDLTGIKDAKKREAEEARFNLELRLQNNYFDALDQWKESQQGKDITPSDIRSIENSLLIDYRRIKTLSSADLEKVITRAEGKALTTPIKSKSLRQLQEEQSRVRPDGSEKDVGFLGVRKGGSGNDVTEFSISTDLVVPGSTTNNFPTMVPTLTKSEINTLLNDIEPNNKKVPIGIVRKAEAHARKRIAEGKSVFFSSKEAPRLKAIKDMSVEEKKAELLRLQKSRK